MTRIVLPCLSLALAACTAAPAASPSPPPRAAPPAPAAPACNAALVQEHLGHTATAASGAKLMALAGARSLRWGPPGAIWTMDYRPDRLDVRYDQAMKIVEITCG